MRHLYTTPLCDLHICRGVCVCVSHALNIENIIFISWEQNHLHLLVGINNSLAKLVCQGSSQTEPSSNRLMKLMSEPSWVDLSKLNSSLSWAIVESYLASRKVWLLDNFFCYKEKCDYSITSFVTRTYITNYFIYIS